MKYLIPLLLMSFLQANELILQNQHIQAFFSFEAQNGSNTKIARIDGSDAIEINNDEFEILTFDDKRYTRKDYKIISKPEIKKDAKGNQSLVIIYESLREQAPAKVEVTYTLGQGPYIRKSLKLHMKQGDKIDRLSAIHFSSEQKVTLGGRGQPLNVGKWWFGMDYPCFYARHNDNYKEPDFYYRWNYMIDLKGRDQLINPRPHTASIFHFPGYAKEMDEFSWAIVSKTAVFGLSAKKGESAELGLLDYITETRKKTRSYLHFNNWYSKVAKKLNKENFIDKVFFPMQAQLKKYGANLDGMCPDHGWEETASRCYEAKDPKLLVDMQKILKDNGSGLGLWIALDGTNQKFEDGIKLGYRSAYSKDFDRKQFAWTQGNKEYYDILQPKYFNDLKKSLKYMITEAKVDYIKHDFNHNFSSNYMTQRHAREKCLDATLELLAYERELNPDIFINFTNGAWFSPFWLQYADCIWMMTGDSGGSGDVPSLSLRDGATNYRCKYFYRSFNSELCPRPVIPIANFMTHGILLSHRKPFTDFNDTLHDWSDYVLMYMARGTTLKELYLDLDLLDDDHWKVLGRAANWAQREQGQLMNTVMVGGDPAKAEVYGYISWKGKRALLTVRNQQRSPQKLTIPFNSSVYFREKSGEKYKLKTIYPFIEELPNKLISGRDFQLSIPGNSVQIFEIQEGESSSKDPIQALPLQASTGHVQDDLFSLNIDVPLDDFQRLDLLLQIAGKAEPIIYVDGKKVTPSRVNSGKRWALAALDLSPWKGKKIKVEGQYVLIPGGKSMPKAVPFVAWICADRKVESHNIDDPDLPFPVSQKFRRIKQDIVVGKIKARKESAPTALALKLIKNKKQ
ncbi:hypothetical protein PQO03_00975 [Lentisphaera profundi]|uniref:Uncharacterized protein n=1 Tax=Lentisphaera profundi TaxID=1658616 RepID=A0ABY7VWU4_9BACT|nr:hypothetical protein [Lentisphaera profundi]WDE96538.1 hypothetical protein PQO03_00975 [Lentisphaera profundi]